MDWLEKLKALVMGAPTPTPTPAPAGNPWDVPITPPGGGMSPSPAPTPTPTPAPPMDYSAVADDPLAQALRIKRQKEMWAAMFPEQSWQGGVGGDTDSLRTRAKQAGQFKALADSK